MNKKELIEIISQKTKINKKQVDTVITELISTIKIHVKKGAKVKLMGFGTFEKTKFKARMNHDLKTGEKTKVPASWKAKFRSSVEFKNILNPSRRQNTKNF